MALFTLSRDEVVAMSDKIQRRQKEQPELTRRCEVGAAMRMRRLMTVPASSWQGTEERWAKDAIHYIHEMSKLSGAEFDLALACYGVRRPGLDAALKKLEAGHDVQRQEQKQAPRQAQVAPAVQPADNAIPDDELDDETRAALDAVLAEAAALKAKAAVKPSKSRNAAVNAED